IGDLIPGDDAGADGAERVERLAAAPLAAAFLDLPVASADVVGAGIAKDIVQGPLAGDVLAALADDDGEFALVVHLLACQASGNLHGVAGVLDGVGAFGKEDRKVGNGHAALSRVVAVVQANAEDGRGCLNRREELLHIGSLASWLETFKE